MLTGMNDDLVGFASASEGPIDRRQLHQVRASADDVNNSHKSMKARNIPSSGNAEPLKSAGLLSGKVFSYYARITPPRYANPTGPIGLKSYGKNPAIRRDLRRLDFEALISLNN
jgi:hypothetical protein